MSAARAAAAHAVVLADGGEAMGFPGPKALLSVHFRPMIHHALDAVAGAPRLSTTLLVRGDAQSIRDRCRDYAGLSVVRMEGVLGTREMESAIAGLVGTADAEVLVMRGDAVLLTGDALAGLLEAHARGGAERTLVRAGTRDDSPAAWCFRAAGAGGTGAARRHSIADAGDALIVEGLEDLERAESVLRTRRNVSLMRAGLSLQDRATTNIDHLSRFGRGVRIEAGCTIVNSVFEDGARAEGHCRVADSFVGRSAVIRQGTILDGARVSAGCSVGPYARLRPGTSLDEDVAIGNFVELKNATLGAGTRAAHLSYIGDATIGRGVNIGCGFITCNFSGKTLKHRTVIEDGVFVGSASQTIAPVTLGARSFVATGTSVTEDAPADSFVISRGRQVTKPGYAKKYARP